MLQRTINYSPIMSQSAKIAEGCFAVNKPQNLSSADVIRVLQAAFKPSKLFGPWFEHEKRLLTEQTANVKKLSWKQKQRARDPQVKLGHGGTLDPMATGVLIIGAGSGTKQLSKFLSCTKSYETVVLFGAATDSYDVKGKIVARAPFEHITRGMVEEALSKFRGKIMQKPPIFSALRINGKRAYEYARDGTELPKELEERPVEISELEIVEWLDGGQHEYHYPEQEADPANKSVARRYMQVSDAEDRRSDFQKKPTAISVAIDGDTAPGKKRKRTNEAIATPPPVEKRSRNNLSDGSQDSEEGPVPVQRSTSSRGGEDVLTMAGALPPGDPESQEALLQLKRKLSSKHESTEKTPPPITRCPAPAVRLRMTVSSGTYVRSLAHDLGSAVGSLGTMAALVRSRQEKFELGSNVIEFSDFERGEEVWGTKLEQAFEDWIMRQNMTSGQAT